MSSRFIFSLRFSSRVFAKLFKLSFTLIFFMTLFRLNTFFLYVYYVIPELNFSEIMHSFVAGVRFDILIFGFILTPLYFVMLIQAIFEKWPKKIFAIYKLYFVFVWFLICALTFVDFFSFAQHGRRMRWDQYQSWDPQTWLDQVSALHLNQVLVFSVISIVLLVLGYTLIKGLKFGDWKDEYSPDPASKTEIILRILTPLLLIFLAARGTVMPHHLALEHSEVSNFKELNEMALNAVWCFDK